MIGVYTANFGSYDQIYEPAICNPNTIYRYFTDRAFHSTKWEVILAQSRHLSPEYCSRYHFDNPCLVMPDCAITIMHGANTELITDPYELVELYLPDKYDIAAFAHPHRQNVYQEAEACIQMHKDKPERILPQIERYRIEGFPESMRLSTCIFLIRRYTPKMKAFEIMWWNEVLNGSFRDQLSFDYCRWKLGIDINYIPGDPYTSPLLRIHPFHD